MFHQLDGSDGVFEIKYLLNLDKILDVEYQAGSAYVVVKYERGVSYYKCVDSTAAQTEFVQLRTALAG